MSYVNDIQILKQICDDASYICAHLFSISDREITCMNEKRIIGVLLDESFPTKHEHFL